MNTSPATVYLVGAGPGDPNLLTLRAADLLSRADIIIYDYLANPQLLSHAKPTAEKIYVGKSAGNHTLTQDQINTLLLDKATSAPTTDPKPYPLDPRIIVRLKGGDPYVFGRGAEELAFLRQHNIPTELVPGITAGIAGPAYAGIPVTHRNLATTLTLVTGHESEEKTRGGGGGTPSLDVPALSSLLKSGGTLVFYMGVKNLPSIAQQFAAASSPQIPAAVIQWATHPHQRTITGTLVDIAEKTAAAKITPPAIILFGQVAALRPNLNWFESRPLFGKKILVTRTRHQASELSAKLTNLGATVIEAPTIQIAPYPENSPESQEIDKALAHLPAYDWILFTSANAVRETWRRLRKLTFDARHFAASSVAAVGPATAQALSDFGIIPDLLPEKFSSDSLFNAFPQEELPGKRFLLLRADIANAALKSELEKQNAIVTDLPLYQTGRPANLPPEATTAIEDGSLNYITFTSASTAKNLIALLTPDQQQKLQNIPRASIGPQTSAALTTLGIPPNIEAQESTLDSLLTALLNHASPNP